MGEEAINEDLNEDLIGDPVVPEIMNSTLDVMQPSPKKTQKQHQTLPTDDVQEPEYYKPEPPMFSQTLSHDLRAKKESVTHQKELLAIKLRQKLKKLCKQ